MTTSDAIRSTVADVDLDAIASNVEAIRARAKADVIAVVKADAYGHGAEAVTETCFEAGVVMVAVATVEEGLALRDAGINGPVLVLLGPTDSSEVGHAVALDLLLVTWDVERARAISEAATALRRNARVHFRWTPASRGSALRRTRPRPGIERSSPCRTSRSTGSSRTSRPRTIRIPPTMASSSNGSARYFVRSPTARRWCTPPRARGSPHSDRWTA